MRRVIVSRQTRIAALLCAAAIFTPIEARAESPAEQLLLKFNEAGKFNTTAFLGMAPAACPCRLLGTSVQGPNEVVFVADKDNGWYMAICAPLQQGGWLCGLPTPLAGSAHILR